MNSDSHSPIEIADSALVGISPHFSSHVLQDRQILLLSEQRSFRLTGKLYVALLSHLDGSRSVGEIVTAFAGRVDGQRIRTVLADMQRKSYVSQFVPGVPRDRMALWAELGMPTADAEAALAAYSADVVSLLEPEGASLAAEQSLRSALAESGIRTVSDGSASVTIVLVDDYLDRRLADLDKRMRDAGTHWLPVKLGGSVPMAGPLFTRQSAFCWKCLSTHLLENRPGDRVVSADVVSTRPANAGTLSTRAAFAGLFAWELSRAVAEGKPGPFATSVCTFDLRQPQWRSHFIRQRPHCSVCGNHPDPAEILARASAPLKLTSQAILPSSDGGWRTQPTDTVLQRLERYVSPITGLIADVEDCSPGSGLYVFRARQANPISATPRQNRLLGKPGAAAGKGIGEAQARVSCLAEAMERYLCGYTGTEPVRRATWAEVESAAPHPALLLNYSDRQIANREGWNAQHSGFNWVGEHFDGSKAIEWTPAWSLTRQSLRWLPTRYCYFGYTDPSATAETENLFCQADSNGCASGSTLEEAILQGFLELVERDACALWWYNRVQRPAFDLARLEDPFVRRVQDFCDSRNRGLHVLDLTNDLGIPTAIALSYNRQTGGAIYLGRGSHLDASVAVNRALAELNQMMMLESEFDEASEQAKDAKDDTGVMLNWLKNSTLDTEPYCAPDGLVSLARYTPPRFSDLKEAVDRSVRIISDKDLDFIVLDQSRPEIDFSTARVVVPGLRHFWARFRGGRLYRAPVELGWLDREKSEDDLNPIPFFL